MRNDRLDRFVIDRLMIPEGGKNQSSPWRNLSLLELNGPKTLVWWFIHFWRSINENNYQRKKYYRWKTSASPWNSKRFVSSSSNDQYLTVSSRQKVGKYLEKLNAFLEKMFSLLKIMDQWDLIDDEESSHEFWSICRRTFEVNPTIYHECCSLGQSCSKCREDYILLTGHRLNRLHNQRLRRKTCGLLGLITLT